MGDLEEREKQNMVMQSTHARGKRKIEIVSLEKQIKISL